MRMVVRFVSKWREGAGVFWSKEKMMKVKGKENCRVLFYLIFLMKCSSIILSKNIEVS